MASRTIGSLGAVFPVLVLAVACGSSGDVGGSCEPAGCPDGQVCVDGRCAGEDGGGEVGPDDGGPDADWGRSCGTDADCDDGEFCNGRETCLDGRCAAGMPPACDDGIACTVDSCSVERDRCSYAPDHALCPAGQLCTVAGCRVGTACSTGADCDDGVFCNGSEQCDPEFGCRSGEAPPCDDGIACTVDGCDRTADRCVSAPNDAECDDGDPCTIDECSTAAGGCVASPPDRDGDGFLDAACGGDDCNDRSSSINPAAAEMCDALDGDCDGATDEDFPCVRGSAVSCATTCGTVGAGLCTATCTLPDPGDCAVPLDTCNGVDDDCDGLTDDEVLGRSAACPAGSCRALHAADPAAPDGAYTIDPDGAGGAAPFDVYCNMTTHGGGWTLIGSVVNGVARRWTSLAVLTDATTFGTSATATADNYKSLAWSALSADDLMIGTSEYVFGFSALLGGRSFGGYIAANWPAGCSTTWTRSGVDFSSGLSTTQERLLGFTLRASDDNCSCFPGCNENAAVVFLAAPCCWVNGLANTPAGQAQWSTHDLSLLKLANLLTEACTAGVYPCNANGLVVPYSVECYEWDPATCKARYAFVYVR